ncbi:23S rRNA (adenine(2503)-C(2))-methyltransferase RlmN [Bacteroidales bacterium OttesenSCG-928-C19]|nr:23S rRNA (adenine(2503)-C(2))-methyltransferase RlmN [Bacteroidales bacterium OttesenSCG-928-C19]
MNKENLLGKTLSELKDICKTLAIPNYIASQICDWLYKKHCASIDEMTNVSLKNRELLKSVYTIDAKSPVDSQVSSDGTKKYLYSIDPNYFVESVYIPDKERATLCISSQVGCKMNCLFCMTGKQGFQKHLSAGEIINQIQSLPEFETLTNIVFMGMGEPFDNLDEVLKTCEILTSDWGYGWSPKRITVSTIGLIPGIKRFLQESDCHLAISLHAPNHDVRSEIMPLEKAYSMEDIIKTVKQYDWNGQRRLSFEYIMFKGFNDSLEDARQLAKLLWGLKCRMNLIRFHAIENVPLQSSDMNKMILFRDYLSEKGITTTIRASRGEDILAACGMLSSQKKLNTPKSPKGDF